METTIMGYIGIIGYILGLDWDNGKENGNLSSPQNSTLQEMSRMVIPRSPIISIPLAFRSNIVAARLSAVRGTEEDECARKPGRLKPEPS